MCHKQLFVQCIIKLFINDIQTLQRTCVPNVIFIILWYSFTHDHICAIPNPKFGKEDSRAWKIIYWHFGGKRSPHQSSLSLAILSTIVWQLLCESELYRTGLHVYWSSDINERSWLYMYKDYQMSLVRRWLQKSDIGYISKCQGLSVQVKQPISCFTHAYTKQMALHCISRMPIKIYKKPWHASNWEYSE